MASELELRGWPRHFYVRPPPPPRPRTSSPTLASFLLTTIVSRRSSDQLELSTQRHLPTEDRLQRWTVITVPLPAPPLRDSHSPAACCCSGRNFPRPHPATLRRITKLQPSPIFGGDSGTIWTCLSLFCHRRLGISQKHVSRSCKPCRVQLFSRRSTHRTSRAGGLPAKGEMARRGAAPASKCLRVSRQWTVHFRAGPRVTGLRFD